MSIGAARLALTARASLARRPLLAAGAIVVPMLTASAFYPEIALGNLVEEGVRGVFDTGPLDFTFIEKLKNIPSPGLTSTGSKMADYGRITQALAFAALAAVLTLSIIQYWAAGFSSAGSSGGTALDGVTRTIGAALLIVAWPYVVDTAFELSGAVVKAIPETNANIDAPGAQDTGGKLLIEVIISLAHTLALLLLYLTKVGLQAAVLVLAVGMPLAIALWPIAGLAWLASNALRCCAAIAVIPIAWALCDPVGAVIWSQFQNLDVPIGGELSGKQLSLAVLMFGLMAIMLKIPGVILRWAGTIAPGGGGGGLVAFLAVRGMSRALGRGGPASNAKPTPTPAKSDPLANGDLRAPTSVERENAAAWRAHKTVESNKPFIKKMDREFEKFESFLAQDPFAPANGGDPGANGGRPRGRDGGAPVGPEGEMQRSPSGNPRPDLGGGEGSGGAPRRTALAADGMSTQPRATPAEHRNATQMIEGLRSHGRFARGPGAVGRDLDALKKAGPVQTAGGPRNLAAPAASVLATRGSTQVGDTGTIHKFADAWLADGLTDAHRGPLARLAAHEPEYRGKGAADWMQRNDVTELAATRAPNPPESSKSVTT